jgi:L,D-transpeptidase ErfK/SrfK
VFCFLKKLVCLFVLLFTVVPVASAEKEMGAYQIVINLPSRTLQLYSGNTISKEYSVAIGKAATPTPVGNFYIIDKERNPVWIPPGRDYVVLSGPDNPLGYRWMEFLPLYGIHGTNAPWTIGMAVSNGCVRMREEDAEELFEIVRSGTPINITYDRVKIDIDSKGQASIGIFPDVYGYKTITLADVNDKLAEYGCRGFLSDEFILSIIKEANGKQAPFARLQNIKVNDTPLSQRAISIDNKTYVPTWAVAAVCKSNFIWDDKNQLIWKDNVSFHGVVRGDIIYSSIEDIQKLFSLQKVVRDQDDYLELDTYQR